MGTDTFPGRFERLLRRFADAGAVPFLGAGVSLKARLPDETAFQPTIDWMQNQLREKLWQSLQFNSVDSVCAIVRALLAKPPEDQASDDHEQAFEKAAKNASFDRLVSVARWQLSASEICDTLHIAKLAELEPVPAHRYLAYLAREGVVPEIVTTNFDTCLETAFVRSFRPVEAKSETLDRPPRQRSAPDACETAEAPLAVVASLQDYRLFGGRVHVTDGDVQRPVLKIYKINGCAGRFADVSRDGKLDENEIEKAAESILLTEEQLHTLHTRPWTEDLFRDRARSRSFVFSGFGSDEAQIRYTVLTLLEEFANDDDGSANGPPHDLPNAPWINAYEPELSFSQRQILHRFVEAHASSSTGVKLSDCRE